MRTTEPLPPDVDRWLNALIAGILLIYVGFFVGFWGQTGPQDGDQFLVFHALQYWNAAHFGLAKQWTPLMCAGLSMAGEPQIPFMSLSMLLSYASNPLVGVRVASILYLVAGALGAYAYAGLWLPQRAQRRLAAALFIGNGFFFCRFGMGHFDFVPFLTLPCFLWLLHRASEIHQRASLTPAARWSQIAVLTLIIAAMIALVIDGSPVAIIHLLFWVGCYALTLALTSGSPMPVLVFGASSLLAVALDAGYVWPMLSEQSEFPRRTADSFTSALSLLWFTVLPLRGKVIPANGNGHELSVYIGPVLIYMLWRSRAWLRVAVPPSLGWPLGVVSVTSIVLGMGSLHSVYVPTLLSPFDWLRPLPGFRSMGVTGRYWGFLALPLSLLAAGALWHVLPTIRAGSRRHQVLGLILLFQFGFQGETLTTQWRHSPDYRLTDMADAYDKGPVRIEYLATNEGQLQGQLLTPTRGVSNCYDMDDFNRGKITPGNDMVSAVRFNHDVAAPAMAVNAAFVGWNKIHVAAVCTDGLASSCGLDDADRVRVSLQQAAHRGWSTSACELFKRADGDLMVDCAAKTLAGGIDLEFNDRISALAARVSLHAWAAWGAASVVAVILLRLTAARPLSRGASVNYPRTLVAPVRVRRRRRRLL